MKIKDFLLNRNIPLGTYPSEYYDFEILLLVRSGSWAYGTNIETSDEDFRGIFVIPEKYLYYSKQRYVSQLSFGGTNEKGDKKEDNVFYEIGRFVELLSVSNPNTLEIINILDENMIYYNPIIQVLYDNRNKFLTKQCGKSVAGYAFAQIKTSAGENKYQNWDETKMKRLTPFDFCTVYINNTKAISLNEWLEQNNITQQKCGICPIPHTLDKLKNFMQYHVEDIDTWFMLSYHLSQQIQTLVKYGIVNFEDLTYDRIQNKLSNIQLDLHIIKDKNEISFEDVNSISNSFKSVLQPIYSAIKKDKGNKYKYTILYALFVGDNYEGIVSQWEDGTIISNQLKMSSIEKNTKLSCILSYDIDGYSEHCATWKSFQEWNANKNETRYIESKRHNQKINSKKMLHLTRLLDMAKEIAEGKGLIVKRPNRDYLLSIRRGEVSLQEIIEKGEIAIREIDKLFKNSSLPDKIDEDYLNDLLYNIRINYYKK